MLGNPLLWSVVTCVAVVAIYYTWVRKLSSKPEDPKLPAQTPQA